MPELPEVETISRGLRKKIVGKTVASFDIRTSKMFDGDAKQIIGRNILSVRRRAKIIILEFSGGSSLIIHLKMTGQLVFDKSAGSKKGRIAGGHPSVDLVSDLPNKHTHVIFKFKDGSVLYFNDIRKFGYVRQYRSDILSVAKEIGNLGVEALGEGLTAKYLRDISKNKKSLKVKQLIMDQKVVAGIGNIYADEGLFCAQISPKRRARLVKLREYEVFVRCIRKILRKGILHGGSSEKDYVDIDGKKGEMQKHFKVYRRTGSACVKCGEGIKRLVIGGRATHYCPVCQR